MNSFLTARKFAADNGYTILDYYSYARLVHLPDGANREKFLSIIMDDLARTGWTAEELHEDGAYQDKWPEVEAAHLDKIKSVIKLSRP